MNYEMKMDMFVIPNSAGRLDEYIESYKPILKNWLDSVAKASGLTWDENEPLVQLWYVETNRADKEANSENVVRHGFLIDSDGKSYYGRIKEEVLPYSWLKNVKEGEELKLNIPCTMADKQKNKIGVVLNCSIRANQQSYRYCRFGNFEDIAERVC